MMTMSRSSETFELAREQARDFRRSSPLWIAVGLVALSGCASAIVSLIALHSDGASAAVVAVDLDIGLGQIAGPDPRLAAPETEIDPHPDLIVLHVGRRRGLVVVGIARPLGRDADVAERDRQPVGLARLAGFADRHYDPAPIRILAGDRGLDQRRVGDRQRDATGGPRAR